MDDPRIHVTIEQLVGGEHELWQRESAGNASDDDRRRLQQLKVSLDQCWDLLRQRRARREFGLQGLQAINTMEFATRALRAWAVPYVVPVAAAARVFGQNGQVRDEAVELQLRTLGGEVVRVAERFGADSSLHRGGECEQAAERVGAAGVS
jgi:hypothetical protein